MKTHKNLILLIVTILSLSIVACKKKGCTDPSASNYNSTAKKDNGTCKYDTITEPTATLQRVFYGLDTRQHFDLYLPPGHNQNTKTILMIHGGAWVLGVNDDNSVQTFNGAVIDIVSGLLDEGYACAIMKYRLACYTTVNSNLTNNPNFYMDDMKEDIDLAINKLKSDATNLGISNNYFALIGESAGANIALLYGLNSTSDTDLKTIISMFAPTLMDEVQFKTNMTNAPYNNLPIINGVYIRKKANNCSLVTNQSVNFAWTLNSLCGITLTPSTTNPSYTNPLSPAYSGNIQRNLPVFLMHGSSDNLVPSSHADSMIVRLNSIYGTVNPSTNDFTGQHKMIKYQNCGHGWSGSCNKMIIKQDVIKWMNSHF
ncbi:MAG TPA: alpha/beta hydrolase [Crocinitomicaceae bacterium]|nr:alpha/beta hydrolase [Crocinitomicaceae bacterium]